MLPSTGYFKGINCPFYDSGLCERPYCHFRHVRKESSANTQNDGMESGAILQKLVSAAVQKVLQQKDTSTVGSPTHAVVQDEEICEVNIAQTKATYNPTPIAELKKINKEDTEINDDIIEQKRKHIPVPYTPRKPTTFHIKRSVESNGSVSPLLYLPPPVKYTPGSTESAQLDAYTPKGTVESTEKYLPGSEKQIQEYTIKETQTSSKHNYVPSDKNVNKKKLLEYKPTKVSAKSELPIVTYQPTPKELVPCFSSDEDEPEPKKAKLSQDLNGLDDLGPEFDILDQILDEENPKTSTSTSNDVIEIKSNETDMEKPERKHKDDFQKHKKSSEKHDKKSNKEVVKESSEKYNDRKSSQKSNDKKFTEKSDDKKSSQKHEDKKSSLKSDEKKSQKQDDKKSSSRHSYKKSSSKYDNKESQEKVMSEKKDKSSSHSKSKSKGHDEKTHKSSSKDKHKLEKSDKHSDSKSSKHSKHRSSETSEHKSSSNRKSSDSKRKDKSESSKKSSKHRHKKEEDKEPSNLSDNDDHFGVIENDYRQDEEEELEISESDEEEIEMECKRIFEEYVPTQKPTNLENNTSNSLQEDINENEYIPTKKRISHTADKNIKVIPKAPLKPDFKVSAAQTMSQRLAKIREFHTSRNPNLNPTNTSQPEPLKLPTNISTPTSTKIRIAHVPYASTLMNARKPSLPPTSKLKNDEPSTSSTIVQTIKKGTQRVAHIPNEKFIDRPGVLEPLASKIPANIRSTYLNMMIDECLKIYLSATDAYARAQHEELTTSKKCSKVQIYKNSAVLTVSRLRKEFQECNGVKKSGSDCSALQKMTPAVSGKSNSLGSWSIESKRIPDLTGQLTGAKFYNNIKKWILTEEQLRENGFPRPHSSGERGRAIIFGQNKQIPPKGFVRTCCRCKKDYTVDKKGFPVVREECIYHPNNKYRVRGEVKYQCCSQDSSSDGCCVAPSHVYEYVDYDNLKGYMRTMPPETKMDDYGVYSLDCEMCYTTHGLDLTRVTVINAECKVVYETLIKPLHPIIDYNTRYSGITEDQMAKVKTTLLEVQATLLSMFNSKTILVGHSLESDFKALKLIHDTVIDTSVLFPHKMGPPYKRALRNLSSEYLKKIIQNSVDGHDSAEDATVCMELLIYKLKEDLKTR